MSDKKITVTLKCHEFKCGCGEVHNVYMERDPKPESLPCPEHDDPGYSQKILDFYQRLGQQSGFTQINPQDFGFTLKDGMRLRVTLEEIGHGADVSDADKIAAWEPLVRLAVKYLRDPTLDVGEIGALLHLTECIPEDLKP